MNKPLASTTRLPDVVRLRHELAEARQELDTLYCALDSVNSGLLILNKDLRAVYSNPSLHTMFNSLSADDIRTQHPHYADMLADAADAMAVDFENYVARRLAWVTSGDPAPMDIRMANGTVLRCHLAVLPGGGRMLIYSDITDIVRNGEELERLATTDGMTGVYNRRHFLALADQELLRSRRHRRSVSLMMIDIDYFKAVNDTFGHQVGDQMIIHLANLARQCQRASDVLARIGGEEFALLLPETSLPQARGVAERLRGEVADSPLPIPSRSIPATVSIGVATAANGTLDLSDLMTAADQALYDAKRAGRNRVMCRAADDLAASAGSRKFV
jgi:diguanylate cyclase (GGDEF)-like protein